MLSIFQWSRSIWLPLLVEEKRRGRTRNILVLIFMGRYCRFLMADFWLGVIRSLAIITYYPRSQKKCVFMYTTARGLLTELASLW